MAKILDGLKVSKEVKAEIKQGWPDCGIKGNELPP
mgnify:CR=1 FL=1